MHSNGLTQVDLAPAIIREPLVLTPVDTLMAAIAMMSGLRAQCEMARGSDAVADLHLEARSSCVVLVEADRVVGILTERDVVRLSAQQSPLDRPIAEVMTCPVMTLQESAFTDLFATIHQLRQSGVRHLPVVDHRDRLVGLITHESLRYLTRPIDLLRLRQVSEVMVPEVVCAAPDTPILTVAQRLANHRVSCVVITEPGTQGTQSLQFPIGLLTERDLVQFQALSLSFEHTLARDVMSTPAFSVTPEDSLWAVQQVMESRLVRRMVVTGSQGELLGIVSQSSVLQAFNPLELYNLAAELEAKVVRLEAEKVALLQDRTVELARQVEERTALLSIKAEQERLLTDLATQIRNSLDLQTILNTTVAQVRQVLACDRVIIYQFRPDLSGRVIAESLAPGNQSLLYFEIHDPCLTPELLEPYRQGQVRVVGDVLTTAMSPCHQTLLSDLEIRTKLVIPILVEEKLWGLMLASHCDRPRDWHPFEVELLQALSVQVAIALQQAMTHQQLKAELHERQQLESARQESEARFQKLADTVPGLLYSVVMQLNGVVKFTYLSARVTELLEIPVDVALADASRILNLFHPEDVAGYREAMAHSLATLAPFRYEWRVITPSGELKWLRANSLPERLPTGEVSWFGICLDVSDRKRAELAILNQRDFSRLMVNITSRFVDVKTEDLAAEIVRSLSLIGEFIQADSGYVATFVAPAPPIAEPMMQLTHQWHRPDCVNGSPFPQQISLAAFPWATAALQQRQVITIPQVATLPDEYARDRASWQAFQIQSVITVPLIQGANVVGGVGFLSLSQSVQWDEGTLQLLQVMAQTIANIQERLQNERVLAQSEAKSRALLAVMPDLLLRVGSDGRYREVLSPNHPLDVVPLPGTRVGRHMSEVLPPELAKQQLQMLAHVLATHEVQTYEQRLQIGDRLQEEEVRVVRSGEDEVLFLVRDISDRKRSEAALRQSEAHQRALICALPDLIARLNAEGIYLEFAASPTFAVVGDLAELVGTHITESLPPLPAQQRLKAIQQALATKTIQFYEQDLSTEQEIRIEEVRVVPYKEDEVLALVRDISDRKQAEQQLLELNQSLERKVEERTAALQESEAQIRAMVAAIPDLLLRVTQDGRCLSCLYADGHAGHFVPIDIHLAECLPPDLLERQLTAIARAITTGELQVYEHQLQKGGRLVYEEVRIAGLNAEEALIIVRDITERKQTETENQCLRDRLEFLLGSSPAVIYSCEAGGDFGKTFISQNVQAILGYSPEAFTANPRFWKDHVHPDDSAGVFASLPTLFAQGCYRYDYRFLHRDGHYLWLRDEIRLVRDAQGNPTEIIGYFTDISDRKRAEAELERLSQRLTVALESGAIGCWDLDLQQNTLVWDDRMYTLYGITSTDTASEERLPYTVWANGVHTDDIQPTEHLLQQAIRGEAKYDTEFRVVHPDGSIRYVKGFGEVVRDAQGHPCRMIGVNFDISDRKQAEQTIRQQAERETLLREITQRIRQSLDLQTIFETACREIRQVIRADRVSIFKFCPAANFAAGEFVAESVMADFTAVVTAPGQPYRVDENQIALYTQGQFYAADDIRNSALNDYHSPALGQLQVRASLVMPLLCGKQLWGLLCVHQCAAPRHWQAFEVELTQQLANQLAIAIQQANLVEQLQRELTERQQAQQQLTLANEELVRATRLKDEFLANMSHELRTPLNAILGMTEGLQEEIFGPVSPQQSNSLSIVERSASHLLALINDILDVTKIEAGQIELDLAPTAIAPLCQASLALVKSQALSKGIQLESQIPAHLPELLIDERRIRQGLINLLANAVKFTPKGGSVVLAVTLEAICENGKDCHAVRFSISDTGIGIAPENIKKLFRPFIQIDSALNRQYEGTGLGLVLVKRVAELHQGRVELTSEVGVGSCFSILLPYTPAIVPTLSPAAAVDNPPLTVTTQPPTVISPLILLAEDQEANTITIVSYLKAKGYRMRLAKNGQEAIAIAQAEPPDLILMDIQMPHMDGLEAIQHIRRDPNLVNTPIIALTALAMDRDRERCLEAGANSYLSKPIKLQQLTALIHQLLSQNSTP